METPPTKIRILETRHEIIDLASAGLEEIDTLLRALAATIEPEKRWPLINLRHLAEVLRRLPTAETSRERPTPILEVALREILEEESVRPIVDHFERRTAPPDDAPGGVRIRPSKFKPAFAPDGTPTAIAAEEAVNVFGVVIDPSAYGHDIVRALHAFNAPTSFGLGTLLKTGAYTTPVASVKGRGVFLRPFYAHGVSSGDGADPLVGSDTLAQLSRGGRRVILFGDRAADIVEELRQGLERLRSFHLSSLAADGVLSAVTGALVGGDALGSDSRSPSDSKSSSARSRLVSLLRDPDALCDIRSFVVASTPASTPASTSAEPGPDAPGWTVLIWLAEQLAKTEMIATGPDAQAFHSSPLADLFRVRGLRVYLEALIGGRESPSVRAFLVERTLADAERRTLVRLRDQRWREAARASHYLVIVEDKLGARRRAELERAAVEPDEILRALPKRDRNIVSTEYDNRVHEWRAMIENKCLHVGLALRLRRAISVDSAAKILVQLAKYFKKERTGRDVSAGHNVGAGRDVVTGNSQANKDSWLMCRSCGFRTICPHVRDLIQMEGKKLAYEAIRDRLMTYAARFARPREERTWSYFCRICGEELAEFVREDRQAETLGLMGDLDDNVRRIMWMEAAEAARFVRFPAPTDPRRFASDASEAVHPLLLQSEALLIRRARRATRAPPPDGPAAERRDDEEPVDPRIHLYAVLFVYAYVFNLIRSDKTDHVGFEGVKPGARLQDYAKTILEHIDKKYAGLVSRIEDVTHEFIADRFRDAVRMVAEDRGKEAIVYPDDEVELAREIVGMDPIYAYAVQSARISGALSLGRPTNLKAAAKEFETAMGISLPALIKHAKKVGEVTADLVNLRPDAQKSLAVRLPRGVEPDFVYRDPRINIFTRIFRLGGKYLKTVDRRAFHSLASAPLGIAIGGAAKEKKRGGPAKEKKRGGPAKAKKRGGPAKAKKRGDPFQADGFEGISPILVAADPAYRAESYELFVEYLLASNREEFDRFEAKLEKLRSRENGYYGIKVASALKNHKIYAFNRTRQHVPVETPITFLFDEQGLRHSWNVYVYDDGKPGTARAPGSTLELSQKDITQALGAGERPTHGKKLVDVRCSICHTLWSDIGSLDVEAARVSVAAVAEFDDFFEFYKARCPVSDLHDFEGVPGSLVCKKCELSEILIRDHTSEKTAGPAREYYDRFVAKYLAELETLRAGDIRFAEMRAEPANEPATESATTEPTTTGSKKDPARGAAGAFAEEWQYDFSAVVKAAELIGTTTYALEAIGATENRKYEDVLQGNDPPTPESNVDPIIVAADSDVRVFITEYNLLRYFYRLSRKVRAENPHVGEMLESAGVPQHEHEKLPDVLPDSDDLGRGEVYTARFAAMVRRREPKDVHLFVVESLCRMSLAAAGPHDGPPWLSKLGRTFAEKVLKGVLRNEKLFSTPGKFNPLIFSAPVDPEGPGDNEVAFGTSGDLLPDDVGDIGEDILDEIEDRGGEDGAYDPFSFEGIDMDPDDPNLE